MEQEGTRLTPEQQRRRRRRSIAIALALVAMAVLFYAITIARLGSSILERAL